MPFSISILNIVQDNFIAQLFHYRSLIQPEPIQESQRDKKHLVNNQKQVVYLGAVHKRRRNFFGLFSYPLPHIGILTLIYLTSTF